jgi:CRISPR-associated endonuclease/helicase Cas3
MDTDLLKPEDFTAFFRAVWGYEPFPWQEDLLLRLATGKDPHRGYRGEAGIWPTVLDLPTGSGKTAALDIAVFHLALDAAKQQNRRAPIRIAFVVDRRLIVDDAFERARLIRRALVWSRLDKSNAEALELENSVLADAIRRVRTELIVRKVADRLCKLANSPQPLVVRRLRGGVPREDDWARTPIQPTILCSTVDQVGSRLLFRGYGLKDRMKPIHAGLLGSDCLILLDEAHLSEPFRQTLSSITSLRAPDQSPFGFALLTATPAIKGSFGLTARDRSHPVLLSRIEASKPGRLIEVAGRHGIEIETRRVVAIAEEAKSIITKLTRHGTTPAVAVVVNRVARARQVFERLGEELGDSATCMLLIGPARSIERDRHATHLDPIRTRTADSCRHLAKPLIVVATQTIEAGVDIDFDGLVTEAASLDALRQRFGRLNRAGRTFAAEAALLAHREDIGPKADDAVYGNRIAKTWEALNRWKDSEGCIDFGITAMAKLLAHEEISNYVAKSEDAPVLLPAYAHLWSQTSPIPNADPDIALFLHGPDRSSASIQIVWRADIEPGDLRAAQRREGELSRLIDLLSLVSPRASEAVEVPIRAARDWLKRTKRQENDFSDSVDRGDDAAEDDRTGELCFRWAGKGSDRTEVIDPGALRPGDLIVVPASYGGCDEWGWKSTGSTDEVLDVADPAAWPYRSRRFALRVSPALIAQGLHAEGKDDNFNIAGRLAAALAETPHRAKSLLAAVNELSFLPSALRKSLEACDAHRGHLKFVFAYGLDNEERPRGIVFVASRGLKIEEQEEDFAAVPSTEDDELGAMAGDPIPMVDHSKDVRAWLDIFAGRAGLSAELGDDVALSGYLHDPGKADPRYQAYYAGGDPYGPDTKGVLAKSGERQLPRGAWERAGLPPNWRHEALSVRLAALHPSFAKVHDPQLVLWLIGTHHGYGRPLFPHADPMDAQARPNLLKCYDTDAILAPGAGPQSLAFNFNGVDWSQLFERLKRKYGIWGLAWLESFVRLADHRASDEGAPPRQVDRQEAAE